MRQENIKYIKYITFIHLYHSFSEFISINENKVLYEKYEKSIINNDDIEEARGCKYTIYL